MAYAYTLNSFAGSSLTGGNLIAYMLVDQDGPLSTRPNDPIVAAVTNLGNRWQRAQPGSKYWRIEVQLADISQSNLDAFFGIFNEDLGLQYLRMTDGNGVAWRAAAVVDHIEPIDVNAFHVVLFVENPRWETDTPSTDADNNSTGPTVAIALTNAGNRDAYPVIQFVADQGKTDAIYDYKFQLSGFLVNKAPNPIENKPAYLFDSAGVAARLATDTSATGATVKQTTGATTINADIATPGAGSISIADRTNWPARGMFWLEDSRGPGFHDQGYYTSITPGGGTTGTLNGVIWFPAVAGVTGGGITHTQAQETATQPSGIRLDGFDTRVWLDHSEISRYLVAWNTAASDVIANVSLPAGVALTLAAAMTTISPGVGGTIEFREDVESVLRPSGYLVIENEIVQYTARAGRFVTVGGRALWGSTLATHAVGVTVWANPRRFLVATGKATASTPPEPANDRPMIELVTSSNQEYRWGDVTSDTATGFYDPDNPDRPAQWRPESQLDGNPFQLVRLEQSAYDLNGTNPSQLQFTDNDPAESRPAYNRLNLDIPQGISRGLAVTRDANTNAAPATAASFTWSHTVGAGNQRLLVAVVTWRGTNTISSVTYGGVAMTRTHTAGVTNTGAAPQLNCAMYYLVAPTAGAANVVVTFSGATEGICGAQSFFNTDQIFPIGPVSMIAGGRSTDQGFPTAQGNSTTPAVSSAFMAQRFLLIDVLAAAGTPTATIGAGQTSTMNAVGATMRSASSTEGGPTGADGRGTTSTTWTLSGAGQWLQLGAVIQNAGGLQYNLNATDNGLIVEVYGSDGAGNERLIDRGFAAAPDTWKYGAHQSSLPNAGMLLVNRRSANVSPLYRVGAKCRYATITGVITSGASLGANGTLAAHTTEVLAMRFVLPRARKILGFGAFLGFSAGPASVAMHIETDDGGEPNFGAIGSEQLDQVVTFNDAAAQWRHFHAPPNFWLPAGTYWMVLWTTSGGFIRWYDAGTEKNNSRTYSAASTTSGSTWTLPNGTQFAFEVIGDYDQDATAIVNDEEPRMLGSSGQRGARTAGIDNVIASLEAPIYVHRLAAFAAGAMVHIGGYVESITRPDQIQLDAWLRPGVGASLTIDCKQQLVTHTEDGISQSLRKVLEPTTDNEATWLTIAPGVNALQYIDNGFVGGAGPGQIDVLSSVNGIKA